MRRLKGAKISPHGHPAVAGIKAMAVGRVRLVVARTDIFVALSLVGRTGEHAVHAGVKDAALVFGSTLYRDPAQRFIPGIRARARALSKSHPGISLCRFWRA